ncbi:MAG: hypothetical protein KatS3mg010_0786 [Acidimicrobiia bacterium]|nr:MAG: hypothetical protein KatS3mg010_0786 [Acidimicrobiia bacterium]
MWRALRRHDPVRCVVLTGAGEKAFCTGIDRMEQMGGQQDDTTDRDVVGSGGVTPFMFNDPGDNIGPKSSDLWKPVIAAVNGMACGGAFYMLGEVEFIIAAEHATFFDPHVTYGMCAAFEPIHMAGITPFPEIMRLSLMGNHERMSAARAYQIGMVSEVVPGGTLLARAREVAAIIASQPRLAVEGNGARDLGDPFDAPARGGPARLRVRRDGHEPGVDRRGSEAVRVRQARGVEAAVSKRVAIVGAALSDIGRVDTKSPFELHYQAASRAIADAGLTKDDVDGVRLERHRAARTGRGRRVPRFAAHVGSTARASAGRPGSSWSSTRPPRSRPVTRTSWSSSTDRPPGPT